jgi:hypothetical protein
MPKFLGENVFVAFSFMLILGFTLPKSEDLPKNNNWVRCYRMIISIKDTTGGILVLPFPRGAESPAKNAGIKNGDIIVAVNGTKMSKVELLKLMHNSTGEDVFIKVNRNSQTYDYKITPQLFMLRPSIKTIISLLDSRKVSLAIVASSFKNNTPWAFNNPSLVPSWEESIKEQLIGNTESLMLNTFSYDTNFSLVDRSHVNKIVNEYQINMSGLVSESEMMQIGKMTGATHLLILSGARYPAEGNDCLDDVTARLIQLESGKVLAIDRFNAKTGK